MSSELSATARGLIEAADAAYVAPISFYEITQKHRLGKWPELDPVIDQLLPLWRKSVSRRRSSMASRRAGHSGCPSPISCFQQSRCVKYPVLFTSPSLWYSISDNVAPWKTRNPNSNLCWISLTR